MKPWIDPMESRARLWWAGQLAVCLLPLIAAVCVLLWVELTAEERMIGTMATVLGLICGVGALWQLRQMPKELKQHDESHSDPEAPVARQDN
ncbi:MAG: hypothetical protein ABWY04_14615 [Arthrobacter sp.]